MSLAHGNASSDREALPSRREAMSTLAKVATGTGVGFAIASLLGQFKKSDNQVSTTSENEMGSKAPKIAAMQECSDLCQLLYDKGMGYEVVTKNELHIPTPGGEYFTVVINKDTISNDLTIIITAPPTVQNILGHSQARCTSVEKAAEVLVIIRERVRKHFESPEGTKHNSFAGAKVFDA